MQTFQLIAQQNREAELCLNILKFSSLTFIGFHAYAFFLAAGSIPLQEVSIIEKKEVGFGKVMQPLRLSLVGALKGPHLFDIIEMIGKKETISRIEKAIKTFSK